MKLTRLLTPVAITFLVVVVAALAAALRQAPRIALPSGSVSAPKERAPAPTCIITVNGQQYDVQPLRRIHQGGDIFVCGTDMTMLFKQQHGTRYQLLAPYRLN